MKKLFVAALLLASTSAFAETRLVSCKVQNSTSVTLNVTQMDDQSVDFVVVELNTKAGTSTFFSQMDKGSVADQLSNGFLNLLALTEQTGQVDGVITNTGFLALGVENTGMGGFLAALGNIYPLTCTR